MHNRKHPILLLQEALGGRRKFPQESLRTLSIPLSMHGNEPFPCILQFSASPASVAESSQCLCQMEGCPSLFLCPLELDENVLGMTQMTERLAVGALKKRDPTHPPVSPGNSKRMNLFTVFLDDSAKSVLCAFYISALQVGLAQDDLDQASYEYVP
jgi:hypothetical protein